MGKDTDALPEWRVGQSYDIHPLKEGRDLILAGVKIPNDRGLQGHSDADVVYHVVADSLLGAIALGDLGNFFPDSSPEWRNAKSEIFVIEVLKKVHERGYVVNNIDCTVIAQRPRLANHIPEMRTNIARLLQVPADRVSVKARTNERLGSLGREEGIAALSTVLVQIGRS